METVMRNGMRPVHPGEVLREDYLASLGLSVNALAIALRIPATRVHEIVKERRAVTPDTALRLARYFGTDAQSWLNLQSSYDLKVAAREIGDKIKREVPPRAAW
jgi:addiction module HigA family antidote